MGAVSLRTAGTDDIGAFIAFQQDPVASHMAAFTAADPNDLVAAWRKWSEILADDAIFAHAVVMDHGVVGNAVSFEVDGVAEVSYWIDRGYWGRGVASSALTLLLERVPTRPLRARTAVDNARSQAVLRKHGFVQIADERAFADARGEYVDEYIYELN